MLPGSLREAAGYGALRCSRVYLVDGFRAFLLIPYSINFTLVATETVLYFRNSRFDREAERAALPRPETAS